AHRDFDFHARASRIRGGRCARAGSAVTAWRRPGFMNVKRVRKESRLSQEEFWGRIGVSQSGGSRYECGRSVPEPVRILLTLAYGSERERQAALHALTGHSRSSTPAAKSSERARSGASATSGRS